MKGQQRAAASRRGWRHVLRDQLKGRAWVLLSLIRIPLRRALTVRAANETNQVTITISPAGDAAPATAGLPGQHFSAFERLLYDAIRAEKGRNPNRVLIGKSIATAAGVPYDTKFRLLLRNLVEREALVHDDGDADGYDLPIGYRPKTA